MADSVCITDLDANIIMINNIMEDLFEIPREKLLTMNGLDLIIKEDIVKVRKVMQDLIKTGLPQNVEITGRLGGTKGRPFWMRLSLLKDEKGEPSGIVTVTRDLTERKRIEEALRKSEAR